MLMYVSVAVLAQTVAPLVLSLNRTASTLSTLTNALTAALAQVTALLVLPNSSNFAKRSFVFEQARSIEPVIFLIFFKKVFFSWEIWYII